MRSRPGVTITHYTRQTSTMFTAVLICALLGKTLAFTTVQLLETDHRFTTFVGYLTTTGLPATLNSGNFTIFVPTNAAFAALPPTTVQQLNNVTYLTLLLSYHVAPGRLLISSGQDEGSIQMLDDSFTRFNVYSHNHIITMQGCIISEFDTVASNGVIHVLDSVMTRPVGLIANYVTENHELSTFLGLVHQAGLYRLLEMGPLTLFAPNNVAFSRVPQDQLNQITNNPAALMAMIQYHMVSSTEYFVGLYKQERLFTMQGGQLTVHFTHHGEDVKVNNALVLAADASVANGVVHVIDHVLIP